MIEVTNSMNFEKTLQAFAKKTRQAPEVVVAKAMLSISRRTIGYTREDTGTLARGWQISDTPQPTFVPTGPTVGMSGREQATAAAEKAIEAYKGGIIWFATKIEYAEPREFGTAFSPGDYMLKRAIQDTEARLNKLAQEVDRELS